MRRAGSETDLPAARTLDFELEVSDQNAGAYTVNARSPGGEAACTMRLPNNAELLDNQLTVIRDAVLASSAVVRRTASRDEQPVQQLGRELFDALVADDVRGLFVASKDRAREEGASMRVILRVHPPELARLPWEFLFDASKQDYLGLSLPLVRYPQVLAARQPLHVVPPLRILGMVARPGDQDPLQVEDEQRRLRDALSGLERDGLAQLEWVAGQTYGDLEDAMDRGPWHIFHFVGHGGYNRATEEGTLMLATEDGRADPVGADDLSRMLGDHHTLRLVVLNACDTGRASPLDAFSSTAGALVRRGMPAVVAMQFEISDPAAIRFAQSFYQRVAKGLPIDFSVMRARRELRRAKNDTLEWGTPVLYLRAPDGRIFDATTLTSHRGPEQTESGQARGQTDARELDSIYDQALAAFWTERWDEAIELLRQFLGRRPDHVDARAKLDHARRQQGLKTRYTEASAAADARDWGPAIAGFEAVVKADPNYRDANERLTRSQRALELGQLQTEARRLHQAGEWGAVLRVGDRLRALDPESADPDGIVTSARAKLAATERSEEVSAKYEKGLRRELAKGNSSVSRTVQPVRRPKLVLTAPSDFKGKVRSVAFSPDGRRLAIGAHADEAGGGPVQIWEVATGQQLMHFPFKSKAYWAPTVAFSPDGRWLAVGTNASWQIWDAADGKERVSVQLLGGVVATVAFSPDGRWLAACNLTTVAIWEAATGKQRLRLKSGSDITGAYALAFSPDGRCLVTAGVLGKVTIWDAGSGQELSKLEHIGLSAIAFSPDGRWLATAGSDKVRIWDASSRQENARITRGKAGGETFTAVAFSPDSRWLATGDDVGTARIWERTTGQELVEVMHKGHATTTQGEAVNAVAFSPVGRSLVTSAGNSANIWALDEEGDNDV